MTSAPPHIAMQDRTRTDVVMQDLTPRWVAAVAAVAAAAVPMAAGAHVGGGALILLLPTRLYVAGGVLVVVASFVLVALVPARLFARLESTGIRIGVGRLPGGAALAAAPSLLSLAVAIALLAAGRLGSRDPLENPLPLFVWTVWWIGLTYLHAALGNLWAVLNPWTGLYRALTCAGPLRNWRQWPPLDFPERAAHWPAVICFLPFAWFELIHPSPSDPAVLAAVVAGYLLVHFLGVLSFGEQWLERGEAFSVFFRVVSWLAPVGARRAESRADAGGRCEIEVTAPTLRLLRQAPPDASVVALVLLVLASVSFDGLSRTFTWLGLLGENPLAYPGRTVLMARNTLGLLGMAVALSLAYVIAARLSVRLASAGAPGGSSLGVLALSLVPIAFGYHFAHSLPVFMVDIQQALRAASDPFALGWDLVGTRDLHVMSSLLSDPSWVYAIWHVQVAVIVAAHVAGVAIAHALLLRLVGRAAATALSQLPMLALMIGYTMFGLWLLSAPTAG